MLRNAHRFRVEFRRGSSESPLFGAAPAPENISPALPSTPRDMIRPELGLPRAGIPVKSIVDPEPDGPPME